MSTYLCFFPTWANIELGLIYVPCKNENGISFLGTMDWNKNPRRLLVPHSIFFLCLSVPGFLFLCCCCCCCFCLDPFLQHLISPLLLSKPAISSSFLRLRFLFSVTCVSRFSVISPIYWFVCLCCCWLFHLIQGVLHCLMSHSLVN